MKCFVTNFNTKPTNKTIAPTQRNIKASIPMNIRNQHFAKKPDEESPPKAIITNNGIADIIQAPNHNILQMCATDIFQNLALLVLISVCK